MEWLGWIVALVLGAVALYLGMRRAPAPDGDRVGGTSGSAVAPSTPEPSSTGDEAMKEMARYLEKAVIPPLEASLDATDPKPAVQDAVDALRDLVEYSGVSAEAADRTENLLSVLQAVTREYTAVTRVPVRVRGPDRPVRVRIATERFKDAVYLVLVNAGRFGQGETVDVEVAEKGDEAEVKIRDKGPGFSSEALLRAFEPFWTSEDDALGLGLPHAKRLLEAQDGGVSVANAEGGGGETIIKVRRA